jgi:hypothetical protein
MGRLQVLCAPVLYFNFVKCVKPFVSLNTFDHLFICYSQYIWLKSSSTEFYFEMMNFSFEKYFSHSLFISTLFFILTLFWFQYHSFEYICNRISIDLIKIVSLNVFCFCWVSEVVVFDLDLRFDYWRDRDG